MGNSLVVGIFCLCLLWVAAIAIERIDDRINKEVKKRTKCNTEALTLVKRKLSRKESEIKRLEASLDAANKLIKELESKQEDR